MRYKYLLGDVQATLAFVEQCLDTCLRVYEYHCIPERLSMSLDDAEADQHELLLMLDSVNTRLHHVEARMEQQMKGMEQQMKGFEAHLKHIEAMIVCQGA